MKYTAMHVARSDDTSRITTADYAVRFDGLQQGVSADQLQADLMAELKVGQLVRTTYLTDSLMDSLTHSLTGRTNCPILAGVTARRRLRDPPDRGGPFLPRGDQGEGGDAESTHSNNRSTYCR